MAISYTPVDIRGEAIEPILEEVLFANKTIADGYVTFNDNIKAGSIFTEAGIDDTNQERFELICLHMYLILNRIKANKVLSQKLFDFFFQDFIRQI